MKLYCIFGHDYHQIALTSKTKIENNQEAWKWINYCIVCTKCGDLVELPPIREEMKEVQP